MPVRKYRSVEEMEDTFWVPPGTPKHHDAVCRVIASVSLVAPRRNLPRGVFKFRSAEELLKQREAWEATGNEKDQSHHS